MIWVLALTVWVTVAAGVYLALSRDAFRTVLGLAVLGAAANLVLFAAGRLGSAAPAVVPLGETALRDAANPLPQALVLTAIVIGFALVCFSLALVLRLIQRSGTDDALALRQAEPLPADPVKPPAPAEGCDVAWPGPPPVAREGVR
ncbi:sodium:proton antiporter [Aquabacterium sp. A08]|uniref:sodium:proton antiporter n=1 Tax=Aquabacterium sp. A08 TaxID=2718532 RepID=UPI0014215270|nr:NADH-quinone oxidoreductase subunit K [Aquabacterium sp. A08]NIC40692.1 cation:proton antiporter [Aquabacterium sp. A08]